MKSLIAAFFASAMIVSPALACQFGKTAENKMPKTTASVDQPKSEEAMSTFDPVEKPTFEDKAEKTEEPTPADLPATE